MLNVTRTRWASVDKTESLTPSSEENSTSSPANDQTQNPFLDSCVPPGHCHRVPGHEVCRQPHGRQRGVARQRIQLHDPGQERAEKIFQHISSGSGRIGLHVPAGQRQCPVPLDDAGAVQIWGRGLRLDVPGTRVLRLLPAGQNRPGHLVVGELRVHHDTCSHHGRPRHRRGLSSAV